MSPISFDSYDRIADTLMYLNDNVSLVFAVRLAKSTKTGNRQFFAFETTYMSKKHGEEVRSIKRNMTYYFSFDDKQDFANGIMLLPQDIEILNMVISAKILPWFFGNENERAFKITKNGDNKNILTLAEFGGPVVYAKSETKYIQFTPVVYSYDEGSSFKEGIRLRICHNIIDLDIDRFMGLVNILKSDMYACACSMVAYAKSEPYGVNEYHQAGLGSGKINDQWNDNSSSNNRYTKGNNFLDNANNKK